MDDELDELEDNDEDDFDANECPDCGGEVVEGICVGCGAAVYDEDEVPFVEYAENADFARDDWSGAISADTVDQ